MRAEIWTAAKRTLRALRVNATQRKLLATLVFRTKECDWENGARPIEIKTAVSFMPTAPSSPCSRRAMTDSSRLRKPMKPRKRPSWLRERPLLQEAQHMVRADRQHIGHGHGATAPLSCGISNNTTTKPTVVGSRRANSVTRTATSTSPERSVMCPERSRRIPFLSIRPARRDGEKGHEAAGCRVATCRFECVPFRLQAQIHASRDGSPSRTPDSKPEAG